MKQVLITGATGGLGRAMAKRYWQAGCSLMLVDIAEDSLREMAREFPDPRRVQYATCNLLSSESIATCSARIQSQLNCIDLLINNAGITHRSPASSTDPAVFRNVMQVDWLGTVELTQQLLPALQPGSKIICIGSMAGWMPVPGRAAYCAAKSALTQFFEVWRLELERKNIDLLMVYPSFLDTPIEQNALGADGQPATRQRSTVGNIRSADWMAQRILEADHKQQKRLFPDRFSRFGSLLWRLAPSLYLRQVRRRFAGDIPA